MKKEIYEITATLFRVINVEAETYEEACKKAEEEIINELNDNYRISSLE